jgi:hypothetical protein
MSSSQNSLHENSLVQWHVNDRDKKNSAQLYKSGNGYKKFS